MASPQAQPAPTNSTTPSAPSSAASSNPASVEKMHQGQAPQNNHLELQRQLLAQKLAEKANGNFTSPTDAMLTPCSKKLSDHKKKAFGKSKPTSLASRFAKINTDKSQQPPKPTVADPFAAPQK